MQLCHIHFYQKIAIKKVARVNAALDIYWLSIVHLNTLTAIAMIELQT